MLGNVYTQQPRTQIRSAGAVFASAAALGGLAILPAAAAKQAKKGHR
jgi:hypothetical protein